MMSDRVGRLVRIPLVVGLMVIGACKGGGHLRQGSLQADFSDCVKVEGMPDRAEHAALTKCLVDRFGWSIPEADRGLDSLLRSLDARVNAMQAAYSDSVDRADLAARDSASSVLRRRDSAAVVARAAQIVAMGGKHRAFLRENDLTHWAGDRATKRFYWVPSPFCDAFHEVPRERRINFLSKAEAQLAGYRAVEDPRCWNDPGNPEDSMYIHDGEQARP